MLQKRIFLLVIASLVFHFIQSKQLLAQAEESTQSPLIAENTTIISEADFLKLQKNLDPLKKADPSELQPTLNSSLGYYPIWYCVAQSYWTGNWYYWYSPDINYARYRALNACTFYNGNTCFVNCRIQY